MKNPFLLITKKEIRIIVLLSLLVMLTMIVIIVLIVSGRNASLIRAAEEQSMRERQLMDSDVYWEDFHLETMGNGTFHPLREPKKFWTDDDVDHYWIDPAEIQLESLKDRNDRAVLGALAEEKIP